MPFLPPNQQCQSTEGNFDDKGHNFLRARFPFCCRSTELISKHWRQPAKKTRWLYRFIKTNLYSARCHKQMRCIAEAMRPGCRFDYSAVPPCCGFLKCGCWVDVAAVMGSHTLNKFCDSAWKIKTRFNRWQSDLRFDSKSLWFDLKRILLAANQLVTYRCKMALLLARAEHNWMHQVLRQFCFIFSLLPKLLQYEDSCVIMPKI